MLTRLRVALALPLLVLVVPGASAWIQAEVPGSGGSLCVGEDTWDGNTTVWAGACRVDPSAYRCGSLTGCRVGVDCDSVACDEGGGGPLGDGSSGTFTGQGGVFLSVPTSADSGYCVGVSSDPSDLTASVNTVHACGQETVCSLVPSDCAWLRLGP